MHKNKIKIGNSSKLSWNIFLFVEKNILERFLVSTFLHMACGVFRLSRNSSYYNSTFWFYLVSDLNPHYHRLWK